VLVPPPHKWWLGSHAHDRVTAAVERQVESMPLAQALEPHALAVLISNRTSLAA
jgi:hypothetical protein